MYLKPLFVPVKEKQEGRGYEGGTPGMYSVHEDGPSEIDEEIRRLSFAGLRTRKVSSRADGSWMAKDLLLKAATSCG